VRTYLIDNWYSLGQPEFEAFLYDAQNFHDADFDALSFDKLSSSVRVRLCNLVFWKDLKELSETTYCVEIIFRGVQVFRIDGRSTLTDSAVLGFKLLEDQAKFVLTFSEISITMSRSSSEWILRKFAPNALTQQEPPPRLG
jgi:hypothetical protein